MDSASCGGNHMARECPDRNARKGKGKRVHFAEDYLRDYMVGKGKGKSVGKDSSGKIYMVLEDFYNYFKGKSKRHESHKRKFKPQVNAYPVITECDYYDLQIDEGDGVHMLAAVEPVEQASKQGLDGLRCDMQCSPRRLDQELALGDHGTKPAGTDHHW